jgi:uncharacterized RDD family membrane protein YckC
MSGHRDATEFLEGKRRGLRQLTSPEGVVLPIELASYGERAAAYLIDMVLWGGATLILATVALVVLRGQFLAVSLLFVFFTAALARNGYFICFEIAWQGATPGKRAVGLRVVDRRGGPLLPGAVVARNLTREMEFFLPLGLLAIPGHGPALWGRLVLFVWLVGLLCLPLVTRYRTRGGDLIAGTMVIALPKRALLGDLADAARSFRFDEKQLAAYGAFELQVLEELLRAKPGPEARRVRGDVCEKICRKIGWTEPVAADRIDRFLSDFYAAERDYLERAQLFGRARADKRGAAAG